MSLQKRIAEKMAQYDRVALQFSGGKDSLACFYLLKPYWGRLIVIWANAGDAPPETLQLVASIKPLVKELHIVTGNSFADSTTQGYPVDLLPLRATWLGRQLIPDGGQVPLRSRYECCWNNFWGPMTQKVQELKIDLLIRGQREEEEARAPIKEDTKDPSGAAIFLPINDWSAVQVKAYLKEQNVALPRFYESLSCAIDCLHCTAYLKDTRGKVEYLRKYHPSVGAEYERRMSLIGQAYTEDVDQIKHTLLEINCG